MKYMKRAKIYKDYSGNNTFNPETFEAKSYQWWVYVKDFNGVKVFNSYRYSPTTAKHQNNMRGLLEDLGERVDHMWELECPNGLQDLDSGITLYKERITKLMALINKKGTRKAKNEERCHEIRISKVKLEMLFKLKRNQLKAV